MTNPEQLRLHRARAEDAKNGGRFMEAVVEYQALAAGYAATGQLPAAIAVCRTILEIAPDHVATQHFLSQLFGEGGHAVDLPPEVSASLTSAGRPLPPPLPDDALDDAIDADALAAALTPLPSGSVRVERPGAVPLFSGLSPTAFMSVLARVEAWEAEKGAIVVAEGEASESVFVVARGKVRIERSGGASHPVVLATLGPGAFFGEMALLSRRPRAATVIAEEKTELLEIPRTVLEDIVKKDASVAQALETFCRGRLVENLARTSKVFSVLTPEQVKLTLAQFAIHRMPAGAVLVEQGKPSPGLCIVLQGEVDVSAKAEIGTVKLKKLEPGDVFGEMSILSGSGASATVTAATDCAIVVLARDSLSSLPQGVKDQIVAVAKERKTFNDVMLPEDDSAVLV